MRIFIGIELGALGRMDAKRLILVRHKRMKNSLCRQEYQFTMLAGGLMQISIDTGTAAMGGHMRVGLEDRVSPFRRVLASCKAVKLAKIIALFESLAAKGAPPFETRFMLRLPGTAVVAL